MKNASSSYDVLCDVIADWFESHKDATKAGTRPKGVQTPPPARNRYLYDAGLFDHPRDGKALWEGHQYIRDRTWPDRYNASKAEGSFEARVAAWRFELIREWQLVFDSRSRHLWSDQDRANVLRAVANAAQRVADS